MPISPSKELEENRSTYLPWTSSPTSVGTSLRGSQSRWDRASGEELSGSGVIVTRGGALGQPGQRDRELIIIGDDRAG